MMATVNKFPGTAERAAAQGSRHPTGTGAAPQPQKEECCSRVAAPPTRSSPDMPLRRLGGLHAREMRWPEPPARLGTISAAAAASAGGEEERGRGSSAAAVARVIPGLLGRCVRATGESSSVPRR